MLSWGKSQCKEVAGAYTVLTVSAQMRMLCSLLQNSAKSVDSGKFCCRERTGASGMFSPT